MKVIFYHLFMFLLSGAFLGCGKSSVEVISLGSIENSTYTNAYFDMRLVFPEAWFIQKLDAFNRPNDSVDVHEGQNVQARLIWKKSKDYTYFRFIAMPQESQCPPTQMSYVLLRI